MTPAVHARIRQLQAEADHRRAVAEFRERRVADQQARIKALLSELVHALAQLPLDADVWPHGTPNGERNGRTRLTGEQVEQFRTAVADGVPVSQLAERFGISRPHAYMIAAGKRRAA